MISTMRNKNQINQKENINKNKNSKKTAQHDGINEVQNHADICPSDPKQKAIPDTKLDDLDTKKSFDSKSNIEDITISNRAGESNKSKFDQSSQLGDTKGQLQIPVKEEDRAENDKDTAEGGEIGAEERKEWITEVFVVEEVSIQVAGDNRVEGVASWGETEMQKDDDKDSLAKNSKGIENDGFIAEIGTEESDGRENEENMKIQSNELGQRKMEDNVNEEETKDKQKIEAKCEEYAEEEKCARVSEGDEICKTEKEENKNVYQDNKDKEDINFCDYAAGENIKIGSEENIGIKFKQQMSTHIDQNIFIEKSEQHELSIDIIDEEIKENSLNQSLFQQVSEDNKIDANMTPNSILKKDIYKLENENIEIKNKDVTCSARFIQDINNEDKTQNKNLESKINEEVELEVEHKHNLDVF